ncbi:hypothetical protein BD410DRAFT_793029 [Rickenella mellea]|uniref:Uncharacterized protein n=1 Tax=Rickenella mellea TaxID=50990 RepID=A0A4Y7PTA9_9AGAM|nr:hypothetical protein BD410DRAFT_793029 [Rickenella mellea]
MHLLSILICHTGNLPAESVAMILNDRHPGNELVLSSQPTAVEEIKKCNDSDFSNYWDDLVHHSDHSNSNWLLGDGSRASNTETVRAEELISDINYCRA